MGCFGKRWNFWQRRKIRSRNVDFGARGIAGRETSANFFMTEWMRVMKSFDHIHRIAAFWSGINGKDGRNKVNVRYICEVWRDFRCHWESLLGLTLWCVRNKFLKCIETSGSNFHIMEKYGRASAGLPRGLSRWHFNDIFETRHGLKYDYFTVSFSFLTL